MMKKHPRNKAFSKRSFFLFVHAFVNDGSQRAKVGYILDGLDFFLCRLKTKECCQVAWQGRTFVTQVGRGLWVLSSQFCCLFLSAETVSSFYWLQLIFGSCVVFVFLQFNFLFGLCGKPFHIHLHKYSISFLFWLKLD